MCDETAERCDFMAAGGLVFYICESDIRGWGSSAHRNMRQHRSARHPIILGLGTLNPQRSFLTDTMQCLASPEYEALRALQVNLVFPLACFARANGGLDKITWGQGVKESRRKYNHVWARELPFFASPSPHRSLEPRTYIRTHKSIKII